MYNNNPQKKPTGTSLTPCTPSHAQPGVYRVDRETRMNHNVQQTQYAEDNQPLLDRD